MMDDGRAPRVESPSQDQLRRIFTATVDLAYSYRMRPNGDMVNEWMVGDLPGLEGSLPNKTSPSGCWSAIAHPDDRPILNARFARLSAGEPSIDHFRVVKPNGDVRWLRVNGLPEIDPSSGVMIRVLGAVKDVTEERMAARMLERVQDIATFATVAGGLSHELKNLLSPVVMCSDIGMRGGLTEERAREFFSLVHDSATQALSIVSALARAAMAGGPLVPVDLTLVVEQVLEDLCEEFHLGQVAVLTTETEDTVLDADVEQLRLGLRQVVLNAIEASKGREAMPTIRIGRGKCPVPGRLQGGFCLVVTITDRGIGMDDATRDRMFEPFFSTKSADRSTGLGLAIAKSIFDHHGCATSVDTQPGKGTTFRLYLPPRPNKSQQA